MHSMNDIRTRSSAPQSSYSLAKSATFRKRPPMSKNTNWAARITTMITASLTSRRRQAIRRKRENRLPRGDRDINHFTWCFLGGVQPVLRAAPSWEWHLNRKITSSPGEIQASCYVLNEALTLNAHLPGYEGSIVSIHTKS